MVIRDALRNADQIPVAKIVEFSRTGSTTSLVLRVNIEGQDHDIRLGLDALEGFVGTGQAAATELRNIRESLAGIAGSVPLSSEIAVDLFDMIDANYNLPKKQDRETG